MVVGGGVVVVWWWCGGVGVVWCVVCVRCVICVVRGACGRRRGKAKGEREEVLVVVVQST